MASRIGATIALCILLLVPSFATATLNNSQVQISSIGTVAHNNVLQTSRIIEADTPVNIFHPNAVNYQPNAEAILHNLGINTIRIQGGSEGNVWGTNMVTNAENDSWADNLDSLLTTIDAMGFKAAFFTLGSAWGNHLGINEPIVSIIQQDMQPMEVEIAKTYIDKLAGNNKLQHNFITDPRIAYWSVANEVFLGTYIDQSTFVPSSNYDWVIQMCDYIRSKNGKVVVASPVVDTTAIDGWHYNTDFQWTVPLLSGHVDYVERHFYGLYELANYYYLGNQQYNWTAWKTYMQSQLQNMIYYRGEFSLNQVILGEFGMWRGTGSDIGLTNWYFSDENIKDYYTAIFQVIEEVGFLNVGFHCSFAEKKANGTMANTGSPFGVIDPDGQPYPYAADIIKQNFALLKRT